MKGEIFEQKEGNGFTPQQRLDSLFMMMSVLGFYREDESGDELKQYKDLVGEDREELELLQMAASNAKEDNVRQHYFEQLKDFFVKKLDYDPDFFKDENLLQFNKQFNNFVLEDRERDKIAEEIVPDVENQIHDLNLEAIRLKLIKPRTEEIEKQIQTILHKLRKLRDKREEVIDSVYKKNKNSMN